MDTLPKKLIEKLNKRLSLIYKEKLTDEYFDRFCTTIEENAHSTNKYVEKWSEKDIVLITYGDSVIKEDEAPLKTLNHFLNSKLKGKVSCVHILPFFPYSSDDGFSIIDYEIVDPKLGNWNDVNQINHTFDLMVDLVINHVSQYHHWFANFLEDKIPGKDYFLDIDPGTDLSEVVRPRSTPLLTEFDAPAGKKHVWTTFSADQVDLNFSNPEILLEMLNVLFVYIRNGAKIIRLDAIAFIWKKLGTSCLHLPETHEIVKLFRDIVDFACPHVVLLTETNVPNKENLSYFGNNDEANMVYQFSLPPLLLHALHTGNSSYLNEWASNMPQLPDENTFFNFTASHDGIGVRPLEGILPNKDLQELLENMKKQGGLISTKKNKDGSDSPYEINITYYDALKSTTHGEDRFQTFRFLCSQIIMMALQGVPAFYIHSLTATPNYLEGVKKTGVNRTINRRKWKKDELDTLLDDPDTITYKVFNEISRLMKIRQHQKAFHPNSEQQMLNLGQSFFAFSRKTRDNDEEIFCISNLTKMEKDVLLDFLPFDKVVDLISGNVSDTNQEMILCPYQSVWLKKAR
jgi:sucrose phosphorylase